MVSEHTQSNPLRSMLIRIIQHFDWIWLGTVLLTAAVAPVLVLLFTYHVNQRAECTKGGAILIVAYRVSSVGSLCEGGSDFFLQKLAYSIRLKCCLEFLAIKQQVERKNSWLYKYISEGMWQFSESRRE